MAYITYKLWFDKNLLLRVLEGVLLLPSRVMRGKYWGWGVFLLQYLPLVKIYHCLYSHVCPLVCLSFNLLCGDLRHESERVPAEIYTLLIRVHQVSVNYKDKGITLGSGNVATCWQHYCTVHAN